jgi:hypothetical protein
VAYGHEEENRRDIALTMSSFRLRFGLSITILLVLGLWVPLSGSSGPAGIEARSNALTLREILERSGSRAPIKSAFSPRDVILDEISSNPLKKRNDGGGSGGGRESGGGGEGRLQEEGEMTTCGVNSGGDDESDETDNVLKDQIEMLCHQVAYHSSPPSSILLSTLSVAVSSQLSALSSCPFLLSLSLFHTHTHTLSLYHPPFSPLSTLLVPHQTPVQT